MSRFTLGQLVVVPDPVPGTDDAWECEFEGTVIRFWSDYERAGAVFDDCLMVTVEDADGVRFDVEENRLSAVTVEVKQVIVVRTMYPDDKGGLRKICSGKLIAQACHASMAFISNMLRKHDLFYPFEQGQRGPVRTCHLSEEQQQWLDGSFAKTVVYVETEDDLAEVERCAHLSGLTVEKITDPGTSEFGGVPTVTCLAVGPHYAHMFEGVTSHLPLY